MARREPRLSDTPDLRQLVADRIKEAQAAKGLNTETLAREAGISLRLVQKHRAGHNTPNHESLARYSRVLGRPVLWFVTRDAEQAA